MINMQGPTRKEGIKRGEEGNRCSGPPSFEPVPLFPFGPWIDLCNSAQAEYKNNGSNTLTLINVETAGVGSYRCIAKARK